MTRRYCLLLIFLLLAPAGVYAQKALKGTVFDARTRAVIPFATVKFDNKGHGVIGSLNGQFEVPADYADSITWIEVSYLGYETQKIILPATSLNIYLEPKTGALNEVVIKPPYNKIRRILNNTIANKSNNNPDKYDWYRCHVYYKMMIDATPGDTAKIDTDKETQSLVNFLNDQHLIMSETYSIRTWRRPQQLQEDVIGSRFSGFKKSMFTGLVTDVLPFHAYNSYITLNGKDYHNPVSRGFEQYYRFNLADELMDGNDTVWVLSFLPKGVNANELKGTVFINSHGYAISRIIARSSDTMLKLSVRIEQEYEQTPYGDSATRWFPKHLNYILDWQQKSGKSAIYFHMKGNSRIDSVVWQEDKNFRFDKTHTVRLAKNADVLTDSMWKVIRPVALSSKEAQTYKVIDSIGQEIHIDAYLNFFSKAPEGKITLGAFDFDFKRIVSYNYYESLRLGLGLQTNERVIKWLSVGGWAGYGFGDAHWKYGLFAEAYADAHREFVFRAGYEDDIHDPGRIKLHHELDKNYLSTYLLQRVDNTKTYNASVKKRINYWSMELTAMQQQIIPKYHYALDYNGTSFTRFTANEAAVNFRFAYAERTAPFFNYYYSVGSKYPIWYGKIIAGNIGSYNYQTSYTQAITAIVWHKHLNRIGNEHFFIEGGKSWSVHTLPLSKLFAGNGYKYDSHSWLPDALYTFGGMMTMYPYEYYTDQFVNFIFRHDFDWKLYKIASPRSSLGSAPNICLQYNMLYGTLSHPEAQEYVPFGVPDNAYHEAGILLNNLLRYRYLNLWYFTFNLGYFHHITNEADPKHNGRIVFGAGIEF